jgi:Zn-dependent protease with chaperone function
VTVGVALLLYAAVLGGLGRVITRRDGWLTRAPRLGATLLLAAAWSVLGALFLAGLTIALPGTVLSSGLSDLLGACILRLRAAYVTPGGAAAAGAGLSLSAAIAARTVWAGIAVVRMRLAERRRQHLLIALCGRRLPTRDAVVLDRPEPAAYCLAGRTDPVVLTTGVVQLLSPEQLGAVLAHEQAHRSARHHRLLAAAALAAGALPELPFVADLPRDVRRLLEMHADDMAADSHDPDALASALVTMTTARTSRRARLAPRAALAAGDTDTATRIRRLLVPPAKLSPRRRGTVRMAAAAVGLVPLLLALAPAAVAATEPPVRQATVVSLVHERGSAPYVGTEPLKSANENQYPPYPPPWLPLLTAEMTAAPFESSTYHLAPNWSRP